LTAVIIIMEMTDQSELLIPFLIAALLAQGIGRLWMPVPLYRFLAFQREVPTSNERKSGK
jgi:H+/Cl- antiporter ClcA